MKSFSKKQLYIGGSVILLVLAAYFIWQQYKYKIVHDSVAKTVSDKTSGLYAIKYDSLVFNEVSGNASIKNIRIIPDTNAVKRLSVENMPDILLDVSIRSLEVKGVKTAEALIGSQMEGDTVVIDDPRIIMYSLNPLKKGTKIELEADSVYRQILGKLDLIKVGFVFVNNLQITGVDFHTKDKNFDFINGKFLLEDVLIDSAHNTDTNRVLFCRQAAFTVDSFFSYSHNRRELSIKDVNFLGKEESLLLNEISLNRFWNDSDSGSTVLKANTLKFSGVNSNEIIKGKHITVDTILCQRITVYETPVEKLKSKKENKKAPNDSTGFKNVYSINLKHLNFPKVTFVPLEKSDYSVGNISLKVNGVKADKIIDLQTHPADYSNEVEIALDQLSMKSKDEQYDFNFSNIVLNSLRKELRINSFNIVPYTNEREFASRSAFQKDRYDVRLSGISLKGIEMNNLINKNLFASDLVIDKTVAKIYRDLHKPLEKKSKVGNYPSQVLANLKMPVNIAKAHFNNAYIEYRENEVVSDSVGTISFANSKLTISNITNMPEALKKNDELNIEFDSRVLGEIPIKGNFKFMMKNNEQGDFVVNGHTTAFDALKLNKVSVPMALIKINTGKINEIDFSFRGNNTEAAGEFTMKYEDLKVDVLKRDKNTKEVKKRGLASIAANVIVKNNNPDARGLRKAKASSERNAYKSFFNLVWKTVFSGMKETVGIP